MEKRFKMPSAKKTADSSQKISIGKRKFWTDWRLYLMFIPGLISLIVFCYVPMYGLQLAFKEYKPNLGIWGSAYCENLFDNFKYAVATRGFWRLVRNTLALGGLKLIFAFPSSIILALLINEVTWKPFKKSVQTLSYLPYFISWVIVNAILQIFLKSELTASGAVLNIIIEAFGGTPIDWYNEPKYWRAILTITNIWKNMGWGTIVFLAALTNINSDLYEAAQIDGATRFQRMIHVDFPHITPTIITLMIMNVGKVMSVGFQKVYLMQNNLNLNVSEIISTYTYEIGLVQNNYSYSAAIGLFNSIINLILVLTTNRIARKVSETSLW